MPVGRFHFDPEEGAVLGLEPEEVMVGGVPTGAGSGIRGDPAAMDIAKVFGADGTGVGAGRSQAGISSVPQAMQKGQDFRFVWLQAGQVCNQKPVTRDKPQF
ncbi:MAG: hypothetical protein NTU59_03870 [Coprothermobacterota bacterium]|nr:hypothetical protein [Coprothermobacterota bacterium]